MYTLHLNQTLPFANCPSYVELEGDKIVCNDVNLPAHIDAGNTYNPHNVRLWVIGAEYGALCAVFASHGQDALDCAVNANMLDSLLIEDEGDIEEDTLRLGNASEPFYSDNLWIGEVVFEAARDIHLIVALVRAGEAGTDNLG